MTRALALVASALLAAACGGKSKPAETTTTVIPPAPEAATARATLEARSGSQASGTATFTQKEGGVDVTIEVAGATPGKHGLHLHETGDCSAPDAASAGAHWNPTQHDHGAPGAPPHHAGDLGNIEVGEDGTGTLTLTLDGLTVAAGEQSVVGRAVVLHASEDDLKSQPAGNSGARIACGVIQ